MKIRRSAGCVPGRKLWQGGFYVLALLFLFNAFAVRAGEVQPLARDEATEIRLLAISSELRCLVCQNESLSGSHADLASDLRREIRTLIKDGRSDDEIMDFMVRRYGDFVRYRPALKGTTVLLWFGPAVFLVVGLAVLFVFLQRRNRLIKDAPLADDDQRRADALLDGEDIHK